MHRTHLIPYLICFLHLVSFACSYSLDGAWDLLVTPAASSSPFQPYKSINRDITFQFATTSNNASIQYQLFVYNCFLSQFTYEADHDQLKIIFGQSRLLEPECQIGQIDEVR